MRWGTIWPCLDTPAVLASNKPDFAPICNPLGHPWVTATVTGSQKPLIRKGDLPLRRLRVAQK